MRTEQHDAAWLYSIARNKRYKRGGRDAGIRPTCARAPHADKTAPVVNRAHQLAAGLLQERPEFFASSVSSTFSCKENVRQPCYALRILVLVADSTGRSKLSVGIIGFRH